MKLQLPVGLTVLLCCQAVFSDGFGRLSNNTVQDSATVCFSVGTVASLTGLDDFALTPLGVDGSAGTRYRGSDSFHLEANAPVRVLLQAENLSNGEWRIPSTFKIDGVAYFMDTPADQSHDADHELSVEARLGNISLQLPCIYVYGKV